MKKLMILLMLICGSLAHGAATSNWYYVQYNGTNLQWMSTTSSNNIIAWDDMLNSAFTATRQGVDNISEDLTLGGQSFATSSTTNPADDHLIFTMQVPHKHKIGTDFHPHVHFWQTAADQTNMWYMRYAIVPIGTTNVVETFSGPATNTQAYTAGQTLHQLADFPNISGTSIGLSSIIRVRLYRKGSIGTGSTTATDFDIHIEIDGFGSDQEYQKNY